MNAAIAQHLNIAESLIAEVQEWANVLWVRFVSGRPRFVSKKVVKVPEDYRNVSESEFKDCYCHGLSILLGRKIEIYKKEWSQAHPALPAIETYEVDGQVFSYRDVMEAYATRKACRRTGKVPANWQYTPWEGSQGYEH
jgi:hypothetical protein